MKHTKEYIEELLKRFFDGQTTESEEQLLADYFRDTDTVPEEWLVYKDIFDSFKTDAYDFREEELNAILIHIDDKKPKIVRWLPWASVASVAVVVVVGLSLPKVMNSEKDIQTSIAEVKKPIVTNPVVATSTSDSQAAPDEKTTNDFIEKKNNNKNTEKACLSQRQQQINISTPELLETINMLAEIGTDDATITVSRQDDGFIVNTLSTDGQKNSYVLRRNSNDSPIELISELKDL